MDFARAQLEKYGWKEGEGLGANKTGIAKAIKPGIKKDRLGLGADPADEFTNSWWQNSYNEAAQNIEVSDAKDNSSGDSLKVKLKKSARKAKKKEQKKLAAGVLKNFIRAAVLTGNEEIEEKDEKTIKSEATHQIPKVQQLSDEQLLKACGGRTAHKAARHGHKLSGKLARLQQQDALFKPDSEDL